MDSFVAIIDPVCLTPLKSLIYETSISFPPPLLKNFLRNQKNFYSQVPPYILADSIQQLIPPKSFFFARSLIDCLSSGEAAALRAIWRIMALTFICQSVASAIIGNLVESCFTYLKAFPAASGMQDELKRLQVALPQVETVLTAVEEDAPAMMQNKGLDKWLWLLRDAVENAENVLHELEYYELEKRIRDRDDKQEYFKALETLYIIQCEKLECVHPEFFSKSNPLRYLRIEECPKLTMRGVSDIQLPSTLNDISIGSCGDLEVPLLEFLPNSASFTWLKLCDCARITSLPTAQVCARWTMLSNLTIVNCKELSSLGGIQALVSLRWLRISGCDKLIEVARLEASFPNDVGQENAADCFLKLSELSIDHHALLLMEPLRSLSSISNFFLSNASQLTSLPEEWLLQNHSALKKLSIRNAVSLQSLPQSMTQLCSLESLEVGNAKLIKSLPDLPTSLRSLEITGCHPELKERCQENIGLDWPKIANIPKVDVRIELINPEDYY